MDHGQKQSKEHHENQPFDQHLQAEQVSPARARRKWIQVAVLGLFVVICIFTVWNSISSKQSELKQSTDLSNEVAPDFKVQGLDGKLYRLSDFRGKPIVLNFWASWCDPCRAEMPLLNDTYKKQMRNDLVVLALNLSENVQTVKGFAKEYKLAFPILLDNDSAIADQYGIDPIPTSFFVNREGVIENVHIGELDQETLELNLQKIMP